MVRYVKMSNATCRWVVEARRKRPTLISTTAIDYRHLPWRICTKGLPAILWTSNNNNNVGWGLAAFRFSFRGKNKSVIISLSCSPNSIKRWLYNSFSSNWPMYDFFGCQFQSSNKKNLKVISSDNVRSEISFTFHYFIKIFSKLNKEMIM